MTLKKLIKTLNNIEGQVKTSFYEIKKQLMPLINALNKATPFLEVVNAMIGLFKKKNNRRVKENAGETTTRNEPEP